MNLKSKCEDIKLPDYFKFKLKNNIKFYVIKDSRFPVINAMFVFKNGSLCDSYNSGNLYGLCSFTSDLLLKGTENFSATDIANLVESSGSYIYTGCSYDYSFLTFHSLKKNFEKIYSLANQIFRKSIFKEEEIERLKLQKINLIKLNNTYGEYLSRKLFKKKVYGKSLYAEDPDGTVDSLKRIFRNDILKFYNKFFSPNNLYIFLIGDISESKAIRLTEKFFSDWKDEKVPTTKILPQNTIKDVSILVLPRKGSVQSNINIGHKGVDQRCPDLLKLRVMNLILGGTFVSRINNNLREIQGCTYCASSNFNTFGYQGDFSVEVSVSNKHVLYVIKEILKELERMKNDYVSDDELNIAKNYFIGNFPLQLETANDIATKVLKIELYNLKKNYYNTIISKVCKVSKKDICEVSNKYIDTKNLIISIVGPERINKHIFENIGNVEIINNLENY